VEAAVKKMSGDDSGGRLRHHAAAEKLSLSSQIINPHSRMKSKGGDENGQIE
jgi:hypothetical protein